MEVRIVAKNKKNAGRKALGESSLKNVSGSGGWIKQVKGKWVAAGYWTDPYGNDKSAIMGFDTKAEAECFIQNPVEYMTKIHLKTSSALYRSQ